MSDAEHRWTLAVTAIQLLRYNSSLRGMLIGTEHGPVQQAFVQQINAQFPVTNIPASVSIDRLCGALDINSTLIQSRPVYQPGLLDTTQGALLVSGAERLDTGTSSAISAHLDKADAPDTVLIMMDESTEEETGLADSAIADRLAIMVQLPSLPLASLQQLMDSGDSRSAPGASVQTGAQTCLHVQDVELSDSLLLELSMLAQRLGVDSIRATLFATRVARTHAAMHGRHAVSIDDAAMAAQLVLAPRATSMVSPEDIAPEDQKADESQADSPNEDSADRSDSQQRDPQEPTQEEPERHVDEVGEQLLAAATATLPQHLIADLVRGQKNNRTAGRDSSATAKGKSGRPTGVRRPRGAIRDQRLNLLETLKAAAPKQRLRGNTLTSRQPLKIRSEDFRVTRYKQPTRTTTVFVVDASGSSALHRLAEAKGAVELLLAECYVRRDRVAMISFRGAEARLELPPTRSLVRAKRELAGLPGGGGTPLAAGLDLAVQVVRQLKQAGETPVLVIMTDGKANIARSGEASRVQAMDDAHAAARQVAATQVKCLFVDTAPRARAQARELAHSLQATYLPLPAASSNALPTLIRA